MIIPAVVPPLPRENKWSRGLPASAALDWLRAGWQDIVDNPVPSLSYGLLVFLVSLAVVACFFSFGWDYSLFPALAWFMVVGPLFAIGLYEKSRRHAKGERIGLGRRRSSNRVCPGASDTVSAYANTCFMLICAIITDVFCAAPPSMSSPMPQTPQRLPGTPGRPPSVRPSFTAYYVSLFVRVSNEPL